MQSQLIQVFTHLIMSIADAEVWVFAVELSTYRISALTELFHCRKAIATIGSICDIMDAFRSHKTLVDIPSIWRRAIGSSPKALCWYPARISCQVCKHHLSFRKASLTHDQRMGPAGTLSCHLPLLQAAAHAIAALEAACVYVYLACPLVCNMAPFTEALISLPNAKHEVDVAKHALS